MQPLFVNHRHQPPLVFLFLGNDSPRLRHLLRNVAQIADAQILALLEKLNRKRDAEHEAKH